MTSFWAVATFLAAMSSSVAGQELIPSFLGYSFGLEPRDPLIVLPRAFTPDGTCGGARQYVCNNECCSIYNEWYGCDLFVDTIAQSNT